MVVEVIRGTSGTNDDNTNDNNEGDDDDGDDEEKYEEKERNKKEEREREKENIEVNKECLFRVCIDIEKLERRHVLAADAFIHTALK